jgi:hypothetical protein
MSGSVAKPTVLERLDRCGGLLDILSRRPRFLVQVRAAAKDRKPEEARPASSIQRCRARRRAHR